MRSRGRLIEDMKIATKNSGNALSTASAEPVRSASIAPRPPNPRAVRIMSPTSTTIPGTPLLMCTPMSSPMVRKTTPWSNPSAMTPVSIPPRSAVGRMGVRESRSKKPLSMSRARSAPAVIAPKSDA
jgi:hypothetical protein